MDTQSKHRRTTTKDIIQVLAAALGIVTLGTIGFSLTVISDSHNDPPVHLQPPQPAQPQEPYHLPGLVLTQPQHGPANNLCECVFSPDTAYRDDLVDRLPLTTKEHCCATCKAHRRCVFWTFEDLESSCMLQGSKGRLNREPGVWAGRVNQAPECQLKPQDAAVPVPNPAQLPTLQVISLTHQNTVVHEKPSLLPKDCACTIFQDTDFRGGDLSIVETTKAEACCAACQALQTCFSWTQATDFCYLKGQHVTKTDGPGLISGKKSLLPQCLPPTPPPTPEPPTPYQPRSIVDPASVCGRAKGKAGGEAGWTCESTAVLVLTYKRAEYLQQTLEAIVKAHPDPTLRHMHGKATWLPLFISQDDNDAGVTALLSQYDHVLDVFHQPHFGHGDDASLRKAKNNLAYFALSFHFKQALTSIFSHASKFNHVIILEEDLVVSRDFFEYFIATGPLLDHDKSLFCISAWNDNGAKALASNSTALFRTDFFPGLGWMLSREVWEEMADVWPKAYWDDFVRHPIRRKERSCIRPEVSRTLHIGKKGGASKFERDKKLAKLVDSVALNSNVANFTSMDLSFLKKDQYDKLMIEDLARAELVRGNLAAVGLDIHAVKIEYKGTKHLEGLLKQYGLVPDLKAGVARTAYKGVVQFRLNVAQAEQGVLQMMGLTRARTTPLKVFLVPAAGVDLYDHCTQPECPDTFDPIPPDW